MPRKKVDLKENNSHLLKLLTEHLPDMLWVKDIDGKYIYANQAICDGLLMAEDTNEPIGRSDVFFALREREAHKGKPEWHTFGELCFNSDQLVIDNNKPMKFEEWGNIKGELLYLEVYKAPFYDEDGKIIGTVGAGRDITQLKKIQTDLKNSIKIMETQKEQLGYQANHDALTKLPNRVLFYDRLQQAVNIAKKRNKYVALIFADLDNFKEINDSLGHYIGDQVLLEVAKRVKKTVRSTDTLSRLGGDEFAIIINELDDLEGLPEVANKVNEALKEPILIENNNLYIRMSIGISVYPNDTKNIQSLLKYADSAMYKAKSDGRNTYCFYDEKMTTEAIKRVFLESSLRESLIHNDDFIIYFQPQVDILQNKIIGMEALVRWKHNTLGLVYPDAFIPLAETTGMIIELDRIVMKKAISQFCQWHKDGLNPGKLAINLSVKQLEQDDFIDFTKNLLTDENCDPRNIEFEVTEGLIMRNPDKSIDTLRQISELGISISIDDFGTGYSSLSYLKKLPINKLKIDKSFIDGVPTDNEDVAISKAIINLCSSLNLIVIAEGVETQEQQDFLMDNGCMFIQGYHYSRPIPIDEMSKLLSN
ncbi:MAG: EAL domain-containing protein [Pseudomonadota bacterium]|nr:EAL domain-containing protein [Pseudomonadota bacterium]